MQNSIALLAFLVVPSLAWDRVNAQSITLVGTVVIQNSEYGTGKKIYVSDASVRAPFAKAVTSDKGGQFTLSFAGVENGSPVRLTVSKPGLEVVNRSEVEAMVLGRQPVARIVMADVQHLADAQMRFYGIASDVIEQSYATRMSVLSDTTRALLDRIAQLKLDQGEHSMSFGEAAETLTAERDAALARAQDLAQTFALADLDVASELYRTAYTEFSKGNVQRTLELLSSERLDADYAHALEQKRKGEDLLRSANTSIVQLFESYRLRSNILQATLDYPKAVIAMAGMERLITEQPDAFMPDQVAGFYNDRGVLREMLGDYDAALSDANAALDKAKGTLPADHPSVAMTHRNLASLFRNRGEYADALREGRLAVGIYERTLGTDHEDVARSHFVMGQAYYELGVLDTALIEEGRALTILGRLDGVDPMTRGAMLTSLSSILYDLDRLDTAVVVGQQGLDILKATARPGHPDLVAAYNNLSVPVADLDRLEEALALLREGQRQQLLTLPPDHVRVGILDMNIASTLNDMGRADSAMVIYQRCAVIFPRTIGPDHPIMASLHQNMASIHRDRGEYEQGAFHQRRAITIRNATLGPVHPHMRNAYNGLGTIFIRWDKPDSALVQFDQAWAVVIANADPPSYTTGVVRLNRTLALLDLGRVDEALVEARLSISDYGTSFGPDAPRVRNARAVLGMAYYAAHQPDSARVLIELVPADDRDERSLFTLARIAHDGGNDPEALDQLVVRAKVRATSKVPPNKRDLAAKSMLTALARKLDRTDVIREFSLE